MANHSLENPKHSLNAYQCPEHWAHRTSLTLEKSTALMGKVLTTLTYIDPGASHCFISRRTFIHYDPLQARYFQFASASSRVVGKRKAQLNLNRSIAVDVYHNPEFSCNIVLAQVFSKSFEVLFSSSFRRYIACFLFQKALAAEKDSIWETRCKSRLYRINAPTRNQQTASVVPNNKLDYKSWYNRVGHISSDQYQHLSNIHPDVPMFPRSVKKALNVCRALSQNQKGYRFDQSRNNRNREQKHI